MARFSQIIGGTRSEQSVELPPPDGVEANASAPLRCALRPLSGTEEASALAAARDFAKSKGVERPGPGEPLYDLALMANTIVLGTVDIESPVEARTPFFDGGAGQLMAHYGREAIAYIYERHQAWQDQCAPGIKALSGPDFIEGILKLGSEDEEEAFGFFCQLRPALRWIYARSMAKTLVNSPSLKSLSGSGSESDGSSSKSEPKPSVSRASS